MLNENQVRNAFALSIITNPWEPPNAEKKNQERKNKKQTENPMQLKNTDT